MWDIKSMMTEAAKERELKYYLNHVGYKVCSVIFKENKKRLYYLNHVGYKEVGFTRYGHRSHMYYLNHVGYKE